MAPKTILGRRNFLKQAALGGAAVAAAPVAAAAQTVASPGETKPRAPLAPPSPQAEQTVTVDGQTQSSCGSDYMVDVMRGLGIEYVAAVPGNTFKGLHESVVNYGMLTAPHLDFITVMHEEHSVAFAHGYAKIEGKPMACMMHATVGLQHGSMAIYNAWADRAPVFMITAAHLDATHRSNVVEWEHSAQDGAALVRDFTKWDDTPGSLRHYAESAVRAYKFAMTPPYGPVLLTLDQDLQEDPLPAGGAPPIPRLPLTTPPAGDDGAVREIARLLVNAENPVIMADRAARTPQGLALMVALAEALQAPVIDMYGRMNFPWRHPLCQTGQRLALLAKADVVLGLEMSDFWDATNALQRDGSGRSLLPATAKRISISSVDLYMKANYQDFERFTAVDIAVAADAEATLPSLIEAIRQQGAARQSSFAARGAGFAAAHQGALQRSREAAALGWDETPISVARLCMELYEQIRHEDWSLASGTFFQSYWPQTLWTADKYHQYIGDSGAQGLGYTAPAALGAALANRRHGRLTVAIQGDGDLMFSPSVLWSAAHEKIPILYVMHNNRAWHMEIMQLQAVANRRQRGIDRVHIGTTIDNPFIDYAKLAQSMGVYAEGPILDPKDLGPALKRALAVVKRGEPALVDVVSQGR